MTKEETIERLKKIIEGFHKELQHEGNGQLCIDSIKEDIRYYENQLNYIIENT